MIINLISIGSKPNAWESDSMKFYTKQLPKNFNINFTYIKKTYMEFIEHIVTIVSFEEFQDLIDKIGDDEITIMELVNAIAKINAQIYEQTNSYGHT